MTSHNLRDKDIESHLKINGNSSSDSSSSESESSSSESESSSSESESSSSERDVSVFELPAKEKRSIKVAKGNSKKDLINEFNKLQKNTPVSERRSIWKRKVLNDDAEVKPRKLACKLTPTSVYNPTARNSPCSLKKSLFQEKSSPLKNNEKTSSTFSPKANKTSTATNCVKRLSPRKQLFSSDKRLTICLKKCETPKKQNNDDSKEDGQAIDSVKLNTYRISTTPKKVQNAIATYYSSVDEDTFQRGDVTPQKQNPKYFSDENDPEVKIFLNINELSPTKPSSISNKLIKSTDSSTKVPFNSLLNKPNLRIRTPQKEVNSPSKYELRGSITTLEPISESSPSKTNLANTGSKVYGTPSPRPQRRTRALSISKSNVDQLLDNSKQEVCSNKTPKKEAGISECEKENKKESENTPSKNRYSTPSKGRSQFRAENKYLKSPSMKESINNCSASPLASRNVTVTTPISKKNKARVILTPSMSKKENQSSDRTEDALDLTRKRLHISTIPKSLPCRDEEFSHIKSFLLRKIEHSAGGCMYISGVPGTGKTATVHAVIRSLQEEVDAEGLPEFDFVEVNGLRLTEPRQAYVRIHQSLTNQKLSPDQAQQLLNKRFSGSSKKSTIILVDELDYLCNRRQDVVYNILDWPSKRSSGLVVLTISNTMDLPERTLKGRVTSRMGLTRLTFQPYSHHQLKEIVQDRLYGTTTFHPDAVQLVARKVAAVSGDARRALDICRRTTELVKSGQQVTVANVEQALTQIFSGPRVLVIKNLSQLSQLVLRAVRDVNQRTGVDETTVNQVYCHLQQICALEGCVLPVIGSVLHTCVTLVGLGLMIAERGRMDITRKLSLNVSSDDIHYALDNLKT